MQRRTAWCYVSQQLNASNEREKHSFCEVVRSYRAIDGRRCAVVVGKTVASVNSMNSIFIRNVQEQYAEYLAVRQIEIAR